MTISPMDHETVTGERHVMDAAEGVQFLRTLQHELVMLTCHLKGLEHLTVEVAEATVFDGKNLDIEKAVTGLDGGMFLAVREGERIGAAFDALDDCLERLATATVTV